MNSSITFLTLGSICSLGSYLALCLTRILRCLISKTRCRIYIDVGLYIDDSCMKCIRLSCFLCYQRFAYQLYCLLHSTSSLLNIILHSSLPKILLLTLTITPRYMNTCIKRAFLHKFPRQSET